jgi:hypothetical protein
VLRARKLDLAGISLTNPMSFSVVAGQHAATAEIEFDSDGRFRK